MPVTKTPWTDAKRAEVPPGELNLPRCMTGAYYICNEVWFRSEIFVCTADELFAVWLHQFGDATQRPGKIEQDFDIFRRRRLRQFEEAMAANLELIRPYRKPPNYIRNTNIRELLSLTYYRVTRKKIEEAKILYEKHPPEPC